MPGGPYEGVPEHLEGPLRRWARRFLDGELEERVALQLGVTLPERGRVPRASRPTALVDQDWVDLLDVVDVALQADGRLAQRLEREHADERDGTYTEGDRSRLHQMHKLQAILRHADSVYRVDDTSEVLHLVRWVGWTAQAAGEQAIAGAEPTAAELLQRAWSTAHARTAAAAPAAYRDAVLAVETLACPLVLPRDRDATLGKVIAHLRDAATSWELELADNGDGRAVDDLRGMFSLLWRGEDRHGGRDYRDVTLAEARAAVHLAVTLVQWLSDGVLRRRATSDAQ